MLKFIQYVCLLFLVCSCSTRNEESVILQNETDMEKKNLINFEGYSVEKFSMKKNPNISDEQKNTIDVKYDTYINKDKKLNHLYRSEFKIKLYT